MTAFVVAVSIVLSIPGIAQAIFIDSSFQCPPGGVVGQPCQDNTHGYVTKGKCYSIYVCVAEKLPNEQPPNCLSNPGGSDCPTGSPAPSQASQSEKKSESIRIPSGALSDEVLKALHDIFSQEGEGRPTGSIASSVEEVLITVAATATREGEALQYSIQSFDPEKSTLFKLLREQAIALNPLNTPEKNSGSTSAPRPGYASQGVFGGAAGGSDDTEDFDDEPASVLDSLFAFLAQLLRVLIHFLKACGYILLADFSQARIEWNASQEVW